ncbi:hypothetical protein Pth03_24580 [Planotetraspora thailandica]|uniref:Septum formation-related domain-containing protein n=1 Tax=Planotetraspora thailandica TaxID=487172 RepID=A0A8J3UXX4_9ACTN|nr:hypothetical protein Pth03_24580 [Planotetraspora thailandica]
MQIGRRGGQGRGVAIAGLIASGVWILFVGLVVLFGVMGSAQRDAAGKVIRSGSVSIGSVHVGDCVDGLANGEVATSVTAVPCTQPHDAEVIANVALPAGDWPGVDATHQEARSICEQQVAQKLANSPMLDRLRILDLFPHNKAAWDRGNPITCLVVDLQNGGRLTGPVGS